MICPVAGAGDNLVAVVNGVFDLTDSDLSIITMSFAVWWVPVPINLLAVR